jgi:hypothetical protein
MPKFRVFVRGEKDDDYVVEAEDKWEAGSEAEELFIKEHDILWSGVQWEEAEEIDDES